MRTNLPIPRPRLAAIWSANSPRPGLAPLAPRRTTGPRREPVNTPAPEPVVVLTVPAAIRPDDLVAPAA
ncbi:MAG TPA: hypothetical protein VD767_12400 [Thermomicrobiales bacterium]|nr:hypothetical protein [Thermomicrobiales bacterium]